MSESMQWNHVLYDILSPPPPLMRRRKAQCFITWPCLIPWEPAQSPSHHFCAHSQLPLDNDRLINIRSNEFTCASWAQLFFWSFWFSIYIAWSGVRTRTKNRSKFCARPDFFSHTTYMSTQTLSYIKWRACRESGGLDLYHFHLHKMLTVQRRWGCDQNKSGLYSIERDTATFSICHCFADAMQMWSN